MRLSRIYIDAELNLGFSIDLPVTSSHYISHVLRLKNSQQIILFNGTEPSEYLSEIEISNKRVKAIPIDKISSNLESPLKISLFQAIGKPEHIDFIIQKSTELGISEIHLFNSQRTQTYLKGARLEKKMMHWQGVMISACEQCGRNILPTLSFQQSLKDGLELAVNSNKLILDFEGESMNTLCSKFNPDQNMSVLVGAEGGFTQDEITSAINSGFLPCRLGPRTLRMETASLSIITLMQHYFGDMP